MTFNHDDGRTSVNIWGVNATCHGTALSGRHSGSDVFGR